jgi:hypothetical protein
MPTHVPRIAAGNKLAQRTKTWLFTSPPTAVDNTASGEAGYGAGQGDYQKGKCKEAGSSYHSPAYLVW